MPPTVMFTLHIYFIFTPTKLAGNSSFGRIIHTLHFACKPGLSFVHLSTAPAVQLVRITLKGRCHKMALKNNFCFYIFRGLLKFPDIKAQNILLLKTFMKCISPRQNGRFYPHDWTDSAKKEQQVDIIWQHVNTCCGKGCKFRSEY